MVSCDTLYYSKDDGKYRVITRFWGSYYSDGGGGTRIKENMMNQLVSVLKLTYIYKERVCCSLVAQSCPTLCNPMDCIACVAPPSMGFPRQEYWNGLPLPSPGDLPDPAIKPSSPALAGGFFTDEPPGKHVYMCVCVCVCVCFIYIYI